MHTDDKTDNQSNDSAASSDSGVIIVDEKFMSETSPCNIDITTSIDCDNSATADDTSINIENIINLAQNVRPTRKGSSPRANITPTNKSSPTFSIRSTNISITSIQSDASSSVIDSDCDEFEDSNGNYTIRKLGQQTSCTPGSVDIPNITGSDGVVLLQQRVDGGHMGAVAASTSGGPSVASMAFTNSTDITIGQKNYYQGPVTIQQFLIEGRKRDGILSAAEDSGTDNPAFENGGPTGERRKPGDTENTGGDRAPPHPYKFIFNRKAAFITAIIIVLTIGCGVIFVTTSSALKRKSKINWDDEDRRKNIPANTTIGSDNIGGGKILRLIARDEWLARPPSEPLTKLVLPVHRVIIAHTATEDCASQAACTYRTRIIQDFHMKSRNFSDIAYNFLVGGDGAVYEARGWDQQGAHTKGYNVDSICVAFIGTFTNPTPPEKQLNAAKLIIEEGIRLKKLVPDYRLYGVRQLISTESPGMALYEIIRKWPNWSSTL